ncbi:hypothetical protein K438DRAFT_1749676 [Mycena galopus ATCC 62051]|nr:hypothetical protein K438DRAFT_1749676 [Mycena galopus ATCC 62051]
MTNAHHAHVRFSLFFPAPLDAMMAMDGSGGNVDMYASPLPVSSLNDRDRVWKKAREAKTDSDSIPSAATTTGMHSVLVCWAEQIIDADRLMRRQYELTIRQEPKQARICGIDGKDSADADSDDPPYTNLTSYVQYYFMFALLAKPDDVTELHWLKDGRTRCTTGSGVRSHSVPASDAGFFVFPDLYVRTEGSYRLKLCLFEVVGASKAHRSTSPPRKGSPAWRISVFFWLLRPPATPSSHHTSLTHLSTESSPLICSLADQGIKIRVRKDIRMRKTTCAGGQAASPSQMGGAEGEGAGRMRGAGVSAAREVPRVDVPMVHKGERRRGQRRERNYAFH